MTKLKFYDLKSKKTFTTDKFKVVRKKTKRGFTCFAIAKAPSGIDAYRIISKDMYNNLK